MKNFALVLLTLMVVIPISASGAEFQELGTEETMLSFDYRLTEIFQSRGATAVVAYTMMEGPTLGGSSGVYIIGELEDGDILWLVDVIVDNVLTVSTIEALAFVPREQWDQEVKRAHTHGVEYPSPRVFVPKDIIQIFPEGTRTKGSYFH